MSENTNVPTSESDSSLRRKIWLGLLAGGLLTGTAIGWTTYKGVGPQQFDQRIITTIAASVAGGVGAYFTGSTLEFMSRRSRNSRQKSVTSKKDASIIAPYFDILSKEAAGLAAPDFEVSLCKRFSKVVKELEEIFAYEASKAMEHNGLDEKISRNIQEVAEIIPRKSEDATKTLGNRDRRRPRNESQKLNQPTGNGMETCRNGRIGCRKLKFNKQITSFIDELKGYIQGAINPFPSARNFQLHSAEMSDGLRRQIVTIIKEYTNSILPEFEKDMDESVDLEYKAGEVVGSDTVHKVKKAYETLEVRKKDTSTASQGIEMNQSYNAQVNSTRPRTLTSSFQNVQRPKTPGVNILPLDSISNPLYERRNIVTINQVTNKPNLKTPTTTRIVTSTYMPDGKDKPKHCAVQTPKSPRSNQPDDLCATKPDETKPNQPAKLVLNREQIKFLDLLKTEI